MPFSSDLLGRFTENPVAIDIFAFNILLASLATQGVVFFARRHGLQSGQEDPKVLRRSHFRVLWIYTVILATAALAWIAPRWAMIGWLLLVSAQWVGEIMAKRSRFTALPSPAWRDFVIGGAWAVGPSCWPT